jgi:hypothetical protein
MELNRIYIVRGVAEGGTVTYKCPSPEWAVRKHRDMVTSRLSDVTITGPDGRMLSLADLEGASVEGDVPKARILSLQS